MTSTARKDDASMGWVGWVLWAGGLIAVFVLWDLLFCGGKRCRGLIDRM